VAVCHSTAPWRSLEYICPGKYVFEERHELKYCEVVVNRVQSPRPQPANHIESRPPPTVCHRHVLTATFSMMPSRSRSQRRQIVAGDVALSKPLTRSAAIPGRQSWLVNTAALIAIMGRVSSQTRRAAIGSILAARRAGI
jgi:hypothetical protein